MKFSLLYKDPADRNESVMDFSVLYDLSLDRAAAAFCSDSRRADYFLGVLSRPLCDVSDIVYRQQLLTDLLTHPKLYDDIKLIFNRYDKVKSDWQELRSSAYPAGSASNYRILLEYTFASLKITSMFPKTIISFFKSIYETLGKYDIKSEALCSIRDYCREMCQSDALAELAEIAARFQYYTPEKFHFSVSASLDETLKLLSCDLCDITEIADPRDESPLKRLFKTKRNQKDDSILVERDEDSENDAVYMLNEALHRIDTALTKTTGDVYDIFFGLSQELYFYDAALSYCRALESGGYPMCVPEMLSAEQDSFDIVGVFDLFLIGEGKASDEITGNDISIGGKNGVILRGPGKTGKTSYLRAAAAAQLFGQAGLPICAQSAKISVRRAIFSHFSSAEEEFKAGDTAGRFEGEVQAIAKIIESIEPYSVVYLNETFQTTSYSEGAQGIYEILSALPAVKTKFIFVTKLNRLFDLARGDNILLAQTGGEQPFKAAPFVNSDA